jgi:hypothetical protein
MLWRLILLFRQPITASRVFLPHKYFADFHRVGRRRDDSGFVGASRQKQPGRRKGME